MEKRANTENTLTIQTTDIKETGQIHMKGVNKINLEDYVYLPIQV